MGYLRDATKMSNPSKERPANEVREPVILAVETSSRIGSAALARGPELLEESQFSGPMQHSAEIFPTIVELLRRHRCVPTDLDQVHIAIGPGSFTGLRIAVTMAKTMHLANSVRIVTVDSLDVIAANLSDTGQIAVPDRIATVFDAKRGQFYAGVYQHVEPQTGDEAGPGYRIPAPHNGLWQKVAPDGLMTAQEIIDRFAGSGRIGLLGDGLFYHRATFDTDRAVILPERHWSPHAANVWRLGYQKALAGRFDDPLALTPFYLRGPEVTLRKKT